MPCFVEQGTKLTTFCLVAAKAKIAKDGSHIARYLQQTLALGTG
jgi:hypothetical protein